MGTRVPDLTVKMKISISDRGAIGFAVAGFTFWVLTDTCIKLVGQSSLPAYEVTGFLGLFIALFMAAYALPRGELRKLWPQHIGRHAEGDE